MFPKKQRVKLHGEALRKLNDTIHERDGHRCIICGKHVDPGEKWHHVYFGWGRKNDVEEEGVTLCYGCHKDTHSKPKVMTVNTEKCIKYLEAIYGESISDTGGAGAMGDT